MTRQLTICDRFVALGKLVWFFIFAALLQAGSGAAEAPKSLAAQTPLATFLDRGRAHSVTYAEYWTEKIQRMMFLAKDASRKEILKNAREIVRQTAYRAILFEQARQRKADSDPAFQRRLARETDRMLGEALKQSVMDQVTTPSQEAIRRFYDDRQAMFTQPEHYAIRFINCVMTDPQDEAQRNATRQRIEQALAKLRAGADFDAVFREYANSPDAYRGQQTTVTANDVSPAVIQALTALPDGGYSNILTNGTGFLVVKRIRHEPARLKPLDEARAQIEALLREQARQRQWSEFEQEQVAHLKPTINTKALEQEAVADNTVIFRYADVMLQYGQIKNALAEMTRAKGQTLAREARRAALDALLREKVLAHIARQRGLDKSESCRVKQESLYRMLLSEGEKSAQIAKLEAPIKVGEPEIRAWYGKNRASLMSERETRIRLIRIDNAAGTATRESLQFKQGQANALQAANAARARIRKGEPFEALMREINGQDKDWKGERDFEPYGPRGRIIDQAVEKLKPGETSEPVEYRGGYYLVKVLDAREPRPLTYDEARDPVAKMLKGQKLQAALERHRAELLKEHRLVIDEQALERGLKDL